MFESTMLHDSDRYQQQAQVFLENYTQNHPLEEIADRVLPDIGKQLESDRIFLYVRSPQHSVGRVPFCWRRHKAIALIYDSEWKPEPADLAEQDPLFAAALQAQPSIFIEDVETASPEVLNRDFERQTFGHRALVHAHLCQDDTLWGILQPCVLDRPHAWSTRDRQLIAEVVGWFTPLVKEYVDRNLIQETAAANHDR